jgi:hypothetical protein
MTDLPHPWDEFLAELDEQLKEPVDLHCIGGFLCTYFYGWARRTGDIDYFTTVPDTPNVAEIGGSESPLAKKWGISLHCVPFISLPDNYDTRLVDMMPGKFKNLRILVLDPYDLILSKLERNSTKDRDDADYLFRSRKLDSPTLRARYKEELRPYLAREKWHDKTLDLWIEIFEGNPT